MNLAQTTRRLFSRYLKTRGRLVFASVIVGIIAGLGAILFFALLQGAAHLCLHNLAHYFPPEPSGELSGVEPLGLPIRRWVLFLLPALGGLIAGWLVFTFAPEAEGHGTDAVIDAFHRKKGVIRKRVPLIKMFSSIITIGSGGSAGREGPIAQIGAGFGSYLANLLRLNDDERRTLLIAGAAGGIGAIFRSPLGGALFSVEVLYRRDFESKALIPALLSSIVAYSIFASRFGWEFLFETPRYIFNRPIELLFYALLGLVCAGVGWFYVRFFYGIRDRFFHRLKLPKKLRPALGGLMVGTVGLFAPYVLASGYGYLQQAMDGSLTISFMLAAVLFKIFATSFTISSGGSGGVFAPSLFIGGMLGGAFGQIIDQLFPGTLNNPSAFVLVGMGAFFAGTAKVPISSMIMVSEMTGGYQLLVPMMLAGSTSYVASSRVNLYEKQVDRMADSMAHMGDFTVDVLDTLMVEHAYQPMDNIPVLHENSRVQDFLPQVLPEHRVTYFPVVNDKEVVGILPLNNLRNIMLEQKETSPIVARDLMNKSVTVTPGESLKSALKKFVAYEYGQIPVVDIRDEKRVIGILRHEDVIAAYHREMMRLKNTP
ncbi:MAG TPA: chloride channel protein [bacterium]|jgi:CIC family chloride channel protein|nr:chloride channel protein [bacterium]HNT64655.1 chloride channel protein [bacterium]HOX85816.1 chloride channel protein [bacterium]HPG45201.1 chloride channel protein [bacterium]HPM97443.1 chloride channel protein [bacterium]